MSTEISRQDIRLGDLIRVTNSIGGVTTERTGVVAQDTGNHLYTRQEGCLWWAYWEGDCSFILLDRPKPELPTKEGSLILVPFEGYTEPMILRKGYWEPLYGTHRYTEEWVSIREWTPAVVKPEVKL